MATSSTNDERLLPLGIKDHPGQTIDFQNQRQATNTFDAREGTSSTYACMCMCMCEDVSERAWYNV